MSSHPIIPPTLPSLHPQRPHHPDLLRVWTQVVPRPVDGHDTERLKELLWEKINRWMDTYGYEVVSSIWSYSELPPYSPWGTVRDPKVQIDVEVLMAPRWDGVWGDLRAALEADGLLPPQDRRKLSAPPPRPARGDSWYAVDPAFPGRVEIFEYDGDTWVHNGSMDTPTDTEGRSLIEFPDHAF